MIRSVAETESFSNAQEPFALESVDDRMIGLMRLILALSALLIIYIDPSEPDRLVAITYGALIAYSLYSGILYFFSIRGIPALPNRIAHWADVGCFLILIALSSGTSSIFFFFFFFAILVASFRWGFRAGISVTVCSSVLFTVIGYATALPDPYFELNRFLLRPVYLLVLGYMMAYWGGCEIRLKRRLSLLKEITRLSNPRFGVGYTLGSVLKRLRAFYDAEQGLLVWSETQGKEHRLLTITRESEAESVRPEHIPETLAQLLRALPDALAVLYNGAAAAGWPLQTPSYHAYDAAKRERTTAGLKESEALAAWFEADSFISVPLRFQQKIVGRFYLTGRRGVFDSSDVEFFQQVIEQVTPTLNNIRLLEQFASSAAEQERRKLARDIHDSVVQPYIGLQYRLAAISNKLAAGGEVAADVERLLQNTIEEIGGLRGFVRGLKDGGELADGLVSAVRRFAAQFSESYDINVTVNIEGKLKVNELLAAELIRFVHEGLSNVRKHTDAASTIISLECGDSVCRLRIENDGTLVDRESPATFTPRSITERAESLGGHARAENDGAGHTVVTIEIPL